MNKDEIIEGLHQAIVSLKQTIFRKDIELKEVTDAYHKYVAEKLKEPCKHEPFFTLTQLSDFIYDKKPLIANCKHEGCDAKIKATGWESV